MAAHAQTDTPDDPPVIYRLKRLKAVGYLPDYDTLPDDPEALWLEHVSSKRPNSRLILYSHGLLVSSAVGSSELRILGDDKAGFERFIRSVPVPTLWERTESFRIKLWVYSIFASLILISWIVGDYIKRLIGWR